MVSPVHCVFAVGGPLSFPGPLPCAGPDPWQRPQIRV